jgi:hypothetical protein
VVVATAKAWLGSWYIANSAKAELDTLALANWVRTDQFSSMFDIVWDDKVRRLVVVVVQQF